MDKEKRIIKYEGTHIGGLEELVGDLYGYFQDGGERGRVCVALLFQ